MDVKTGKEHALFQCIENSDEEGVSVQLHKLGEKLSVDAIVDAQGNTPLHRAARKGNTSIIKLLLNKKANINLRNREEWNALHFSVFHKHTAATELLLKKRINLFAFNSSGLTALHIAGLEGHTEMISLLLQHGADINETSKTGWTSLHLAASNDNVTACQSLLQSRADPNIIKMPHGTALHIAARAGYWKTCIALVNAGAVVEAKDKLGRKPVDLAKQHPRVEKILRTAEETTFSRRMIRAISDADDVLIEREEQYLNALEEQLFNDMDEYVDQRKSQRFSVAKKRSDSSLLSEIEREERRFSRNVRRKSVLPSLAKTSSLAPPLQAWRGSGLHLFANEDEEVIEEEEYLRRGNRADCVLMTFGSFTGEDDGDMYAYPGSSKVIQSSNMLWSWLARVAGAVVDKQAQESMEHILRLLNTLFQESSQARSVKSLLSLTALILYHNNTHLRSERLVEDSDLIDCSIHFFKFSCAAYGWKMLNPLMFANKRKAVLLQGFMTGDVMNNKALCEHTGIREGDIIATKWTSSDYHPAHYIALDHATQSIILAIRGSFHVKDALVDLVAAASPFQGGYAHTGMLECAKRKLLTVRLPLLQCVAKHPTYKVVIIGHSLGAGTAALLTLLLKDEIPCSVRLQCYAYAPPCVLSPQLAKASETLISSFILGNDCVPRLSYASVAKLKDLSTALMNEGSSGVSVLLKAKRGQVNIANLSSEIPFDLDTALLPPGRCFHIIGEDCLENPAEWIEEENRKRCFRIEHSCPTLFNEVIVCPAMFSDHVPWNYQTAFAGLQLRQQLYRQYLKTIPME